MPPNYPHTKPHSFLLPFIISLALLVAAVIFGGWAFSSRRDYKNNSDQKAAAAASLQQKQTAAADAGQYAEAAKQPLKTYISPEPYGSIAVNYPRTWSAYVIEATTNSGNSSTPVDGYFQPNFVPNVQDQTIAFALRLQVTQTSYDQVLGQFGDLAKQQKVTIKPFSFAKTPSVVGVRIDGQIFTNKQGSMILVPLRDKTLKLWTESSQFSADFNNNILPNISFSP